jgi:polysaccharide biosynthesis protein PslJ
VSDVAVAPARLPLWPLTLMFALAPVWWVLGAWYLAWPLFGLLLCALLLLRGAVALPTGAAVWLVFLGLVLASATRIDRVTAYLTFGLRVGHMFTAFMVFLYVYNLARDGVSWRALARPMCLFWLALVALGWAGVLAPRFTAASPVEMLLPGSIAGERFIRSLTHLHLTEFNALGRQPIFRPAAPYPYTNNFGTAFAVLVPFLFAYLASVRRGALRVAVLLSLPLSLVPAFLTLNRGMFVGLGAGLAYLAMRALARGQVRVVAAAVGLVLLGWLVTFVVPVDRLIADRTSRTSSTSDRVDLYVQTWNAVLRSPVLGFGASNSVDTTAAAEPLGTQGQFWQVMYSYGIPALLCFVLVLVLVARRLAAAVSPAGLCLGTVPVVALVIMPFYGYTDPNMAVMFFAIALGLAAVDGPVRRDGPRAREGLPRHDRPLRHDRLLRHEDPAVSGGPR